MRVLLPALVALPARREVHAELRLDVNGAARKLDRAAIEVRAALRDLAARGLQAQRQRQHRPEIPSHARLPGVQPVRVGRGAHHRRRGRNGFRRHFPARRGDRRRVPAGFVGGEVTVHRPAVVAALAGGIALRQPIFGALAARGDGMLDAHVGRQMTVAGHLRAPQPEQRLRVVGFFERDLSQNLVGFVAAALKVQRLPQRQARLGIVGVFPHCLLGPTPAIVELAGAEIDVRQLQSQTLAALVLDVGLVVPQRFGKFARARKEAGRRQLRVPILGIRLEIACERISPQARADPSCPPPAPV